MCAEQLRLSTRSKKTYIPYEQGKPLCIKHANILKKIIAKHGWPTVSKVGTKASWSAWLIAQHATHDLGFQKQCIALMREAEHDIDKSNLAHLIDRVRILEGKPQLFGTHFQEDGTPHPIQDKKNLARRRREYNLPITLR
ncbi:MAG: hypothetical protein COT71_01580 [Candidatus Andersenbacteria bacterium CG10_big_fil_rev_8_21_14_0_10_54_11]|uniref:Uncharacterized protein n=1 Tax=Candidatus Andersenbacteria bacterium CG10_big_fil_rev_8_21_14_0_10_54_11 TaxID=1974485 RepID=A0A2M6WZS3_9BACT|nr:MAG: hypothetical protein COT71_01580 [Candidatus Andersenbacteria bacterium CG10_big_fil_rev_8_21_14_0_10_54_11]